VVGQKLCEFFVAGSSDFENTVNFQFELVFWRASVIDVLLDELKTSFVNL
jgi:hypothetical protein